MSTRSNPPFPVLTGTLYGLSAVVIWAIYLAYTRVAVSGDLTPNDIILLRFGVAGLLLLPWVLMNSPATLGGVGWWRGLALALAVGPLFIFTASGAFVYLPLAHGAVLQPSTAALTSIAVAIVLLREKVTVNRIAGALIIITGIALIASGGDVTAGADAWKGYVLSVFAGFCWATFTILIRLWNIDGLPATAAASVISGAFVVPAFFTFDSLERIAALPTDILLTQLFVQGVLAGMIAIIAYGRAVTHLGASGAALFPALVPAATLVAGIPITGEWPAMVEWIGAIMATLGLMVAVGVFKHR